MPRGELQTPASPEPSGEEAQDPGTPPVPEDPASPPAPVPATKDFWDKFGILSRAGLALVGIVVTVVVPFLLHSYQERSRESQARREIEEFEVQHMLARAQLASGLLTQLTDGTAAERRVALEILGTVAPDLARSVVRVLPEDSVAGAEGGRGPEARETLGEIVARAESRRELDRRIAHGETYLRYDLAPQAARELLEAARLVPEHLHARVDWDLVEEARGDYEHDRYQAAAEKLRRALAPLAAAGT